jgi:hypothetical protein
MALPARQCLDQSESRIRHADLAVHDGDCLDWQQHHVAGSHASSDDACLLRLELAKLLSTTHMACFLHQQLSRGAHPKAGIIAKHLASCFVGAVLLPQ